LFSPSFFQSYSLLPRFPLDLLQRVFFSLTDLVPPSPLFTSFFFLDTIYLNFFLLLSREFEGEVRNELPCKPSIVISYSWRSCSFSPCLRRFWCWVPFCSGFIPPLQNLFLLQCSSISLLLSMTFGLIILPQPSFWLCTSFPWLLPGL